MEWIRDKIKNQKSTMRPLEDNGETLLGPPHECPFLTESQQEEWGFVMVGQCIGMNIPSVKKLEQLHKKHENVGRSYTLTGEELLQR